mmetsp:Transcript_23909/g.34166  ORF Transcript_23909/g.34166 Transcript_23909/m.34166 type:complete len:96 (+) Transcript_23909:102-389(+)
MKTRGATFARHGTTTFGGRVDAVEFTYVDAVHIFTQLVRRHLVHPHITILAIETRTGAIAFRFAGAASVAGGAELDHVGVGGRGLHGHNNIMVIR